MDKSTAQLTSPSPQKANNSKDLKGFTLAEVLITLTIIGVIAAITLPNLIAKYKEKVTVEKVKLAYSILSDAYKRSVVENGPPSNWGIADELSSWGNSKNAELLLEKLTPYMKISKYCGSQKGCWQSDTPYHWLNGTTNGDVLMGNGYNYATAVLENGWPIATYKAASTNYGTSPDLKTVRGHIYIWIDPKGKEIVGKDIFTFYVTENGILPAGLKEDTYSTPDDCKPTGRAQGCAAWVIYKGNMDYLRRNISWDE